jgi:hypothetical protein
MEKLKKQIFVPTDFHAKLKHRAVEERSTIEKTIIEILKKEFNIEGDNNNNNKK